MLNMRNQQFSWEKWKALLIKDDFTSIYKHLCGLFVLFDPSNGNAHLQIRNLWNTPSQQPMVICRLNCQLAQGDGWDKKGKLLHVLNPQTFVINAVQSINTGHSSTSSNVGSVSKGTKKIPPVASHGRQSSVPSSTYSGSSSGGECR